MRQPDDELEALNEGGLYRQIRNVLSSSQGARVGVDGRKMLNFSSNDYLGLAGSDAVKGAFIQAAERFGVGSGASRLVCGTQAPHWELEGMLASFLMKDQALVFSTGFSAASGVLGALLGKDDVVILDKLCHASLVDGARASGAKLRVFPHNNLDNLR